MPKILVLQGIPASGKSTFAKEFVKGKKDWIRVCRDDLREMRGDYWIPEQEDCITYIEHNCALGASLYDLNIIVDATNLNKRSIDRWYAFASIYNYVIEFKQFDIELEEAIERDSKRERPVGREVITKFYNNYVKIKNNRS